MNKRICLIKKLCYIHQCTAVIKIKDVYVHCDLYEGHDNSYKHIEEWIKEESDG